MSESLLERWRDALPVGDATPLVTLGEGGTPLVRAERVGRELGIELWLKCEGLNPTGSFKDRGMALAVAKAVEQGAHGIVCASTGNTAASAAAYAARAGLRAVIFHPAGAVADAKLAQVRAAGAELVPVEGAFHDAFAAALELAERDAFTMVNSTNPFRLEGQKTAALELIEQLDGPPDVLALPYGGGGNTTAYAKGFADAGTPLPRILAVQADRRRETVASAIRIAEPVHRTTVEAAVDASGGAIVSVSDDEILHAWRRLARDEGLLCEPASAASVAGLPALVREGERVVAVLTGHGLKDPEAGGRP